MMSTRLVKLNGTYGFGDTEVPEAERPRRLVPVTARWSCEEDACFNEDDVPLNFVRELTEPVGCVDDL